MFKLEIIPGLLPDDECSDWHYEMRSKENDLEQTRKYYKENPPKVGDLVVVLHTSSYKGMLKPHVTRIDAITDRGRIVVNHRHEGWAGKSFWKSGQNCYAPKGQCWLVPPELYRDIPLKRETHDKRRSEWFERKRQAKKLSVGEMAKMLGGAQNFLKEVSFLQENYGISKAESIEQINHELIDEKELLGTLIRHSGIRMNREIIRNHSRYFLEQRKQNNV